MTLTKAEALIDEAKATICGPRQEQYGHPRINFERIATLWNIHLEKKLGPMSRISARDVAIMMIGLKLAREAQGPKHDSLVDIVGYAGLAAELTE